jgi:hypothetical protein
MIPSEVENLRSSGNDKRLVLRVEKSLDSSGCELNIIGLEQAIFEIMA